MTDDELDVVTAPVTRTTAGGPATKYWTPARMKQVVPVPMPVVTADEHERADETVRAALAGVNTSAGVVVAPRLPARRRTAAPASSPTRQTNRADVSVDPFETTLKMFMSFGGVGMIGSAFIVGKRAVLTAGHCVWDRGTWASNIQFIPRYNRGSRPLGTFTAVKTTTLREYTERSPDNGKYHYDIAACVVDKDFPDELGVAGYALNQVLTAGKLRSIGYPGSPYRNFPFDGEEMWTSLGDYWEEGDAGRGTTLARNFGHYNDMTGGCSGGPIFTDGPTPVVVGLNSHVVLQSTAPNAPREEPPRMYSPFFGDPVKRLINWLEANGGRPNQPGQQDEPDPEPDPTPDPSDRDQALKEGLTEVVQKLTEIISRL